MKERNPEKSKAAILTAAENEFAQKGFFGARVDEIAAKADINKRMIYAYFGDKEALYNQVLLNTYSKMEAVENDLVKQNLQGEALIKNIISTYFDFLFGNPNFVNILMWENLNKGFYLKRLENSTLNRKSIKYFINAIENGKTDGIFNSNIDSHQVVLSMITTCFANFSNQYTLSKLFNTDLTDKKIIEERKQHTTDLILSYLKKENCNE